ncbi:zinc finger protein 431-like [Littorina saxatilis]|uniref:zinc finger protein 431-like n=1 Tax=Littorina saxatilis TaxID=31220 RepID=UPI0038B4DC28
MCFYCAVAFTGASCSHRHRVAYKAKETHANIYVCFHCGVVPCTGASCLHRHRMAHLQQEPGACGESDDECDDGLTVSFSPDLHKSSQKGGERQRFSSANRVKSEPGEWSEKCEMLVQGTDTRGFGFTNTDTETTGLREKGVFPGGSLHSTTPDNTLILGKEYAATSDQISDSTSYDGRTHFGEDKPEKEDSCGDSLLHSSREASMANTEQRPHVCTECGASFKWKNCWKRHMLIHSGRKPHKCVVCDAAFVSANSLKTHMLKHTGEKKHVCMYCSASFSWSSHLKRHLLQHTGEKPYVCSECDCAFTSGAGLKYHMFSHSGQKPYACDQCDSAFRCLINLKRHLQLHIGEKPHACPQCSATFTLQGYLKKHMRTHNRKRSTVQQEFNNHGDRLVVSIPTKLPRKKKVKNTVKPHRVSSPVSSISEVNSELTQCPEQVGVLKKEAIKNTDPDSSKYATSESCDVGERRRVTAGSLFAASMKDVRIDDKEFTETSHVSTQPTNSTLCNKTKSKGSVGSKTQRKNIDTDGDRSDKNGSSDNTGEKPYSFMVDGSSKDGSSNNTREKPYTCTVCGTSFRWKNCWKRHMLIHSGQRSHKCVLCNSSFFSANSLNTHMMKHAGHRPHACTQCGAAFTWSSHLKRHMLTHTGEKPYICAQCDSTFSSSGGLNYHMLSHTGQRPYSCNQCGATYTCSVGLKRHKLKHSGVRPYACSHCAATFSQSTYLKKHMLTHARHVQNQIDDNWKSDSVSAL